MKLIKLYSLLLCILMLLPILASCSGERFHLLYEVEQNGLTFCARGKGDRVKQIVIKEKGKVIWSKRVNTDRKMEKIDGTYGLSVQDLNFDGYDDILIAIERNGDCIRYDCYIRVGEKPKYDLHEELSKLYNVKANAELGAIFAFEQDIEARGSDEYLRIDKTTKYFWREGALVPDMYAAVQYYSGGEQTPYFYSVAYYDEELKKFGDSYDLWLTEEEYEATDWSFLYYFK
ncbi:MAG: hypothetical protein E7659_02985 [Ruminococcaceae bacterium]|nr:hypothetical protein [Oscillospiraceae bacterium]